MEAQLRPIFANRYLVAGRGERWSGSTGLTELQMKVDPTLLRISTLFSVLALAACSDDHTARDFAACKLRAIDQHWLDFNDIKSEGNAAYYIHVCMEAAGYEVTPECRGLEHASIDFSHCYKNRNSWWSR